MDPFELDSILKYAYADKNPFLSDDLTELLKSLIPEKWKTKDKKKKWDQKVEEFVKYYNKYVEGVCGNQEIHSDDWFYNKNERKWTHFQNLLENRSQNYSVHY